MNNRIHFLEIPFERGQVHTGLRYSADLFKKYLDKISILNEIDFRFSEAVKEPEHWVYKKVQSELDLIHYKLDYYQSAYHKINEKYSDQNPIVNWGGDHSVALSTVSAFLNNYPEGYIIWIDAHADINLPASSLTGNFHGTPAAFLLNIDNIGQRQLPWVKQFLSPQKIIYLGLRDVDPFEEDLLYGLGIKIYSMEDVRKKGISYIMKEIRRITADRPVHVTFDIDSVDPIFAPCTGVPVCGGFDRNEILYISRQLSQLKVKSLDIAEINPFIGSEEDLEKTFSLALAFLIELYATEKRSFHERDFTANSIYITK